MELSEIREQSAKAAEQVCEAAKLMMSLSAAVFGGVMYMQIAGACSRTQAAVLGTAMLVCMAICYADLCAAKRRRAAEEAKARKAARVSMDKAAHIAYRADLMRQIR